MENGAKMDDLGKSSKIQTMALQLTRASVAIAIVSNHWSGPYLERMMPQNQLAIDFFFAMEGYIAGRTYLGAGPEAGRWQPIRRRVWKVYPLYLLGLVLGFFAVLPAMLSGHEGWSIVTGSQAAALNLFMLPAFFSSVESGAVYPFDTPTWAIVLELWAFAAFWLLRSRLTFRILLAMVSVAAIIDVALAVATLDPNAGFRASGSFGGISYWGGIPRVIYGFFGGALLHVFIKERGPILPRLNPLIVVAGFAATLFVSLHFVGPPLLLVAVPLIVWLAAVSADVAWLGPLARAADRHVYALYLLGFPVLIGTRTLGEYWGIPKDVMGSLAGYLVTIGVVILAAHLATRFFDEPLQKKLQGKTAQAQQPVAA